MSGSRARRFWTRPGLLVCLGSLGALLLSTMCGCGYQNVVTLLSTGVAQPAVSDPLLIQLTGTEHRWKIEYLSSENSSNKGVIAKVDALPTGYDVRVPAGANVVLVLRSNDFIYTLEIPELGLKEIAVPALEFRMPFRSEQEGTFSLVGEELCEAPEGLGMGRLVVESRSDFLAWLRSQNTTL